MIQTELFDLVNAEPKINSNEQGANIPDANVPADQRCRICLETETANRHLAKTICPCSPKNPIHFDCLSAWMTKKIKSVKTGVTIYNMNGLICDMCQAKYPYSIQQNEKNFPIVKIVEPLNDPYILISAYEIESERVKIIYLIELKSNVDKTISVGRNERNELHFSDASVSRVHSHLLWSKNQLFLYDNDSKFGTLLLVKGRALIKQIENQRLAIDRFMLEFAVKTQIPRVENVLVDPLTDNQEIFRKEDNPQEQRPRLPPTGRSSRNIQLQAQQSLARQPISSEQQPLQNRLENEIPIRIPSNQSGAALLPSSQSLAQTPILVPKPSNQNMQPGTSFHSHPSLPNHNFPQPLSQPLFAPQPTPLPAFQAGPNLFPSQSQPLFSNQIPGQMVFGPQIGPMEMAQPLFPPQNRPLFPVQNSPQVVTQPQPLFLPQNPIVVSGQPLTQTPVINQPQNQANDPAQVNAPANQGLENILNETDFLNESGSLRFSQSNRNLNVRSPQRHYQF